ncbi:MAG TPA: hypothetical protein VMZ52_18665, partial [Bryobacteraceae bacterium]|nr:hypothetical protein [Bryobacteraceae bacterium]
MTFERPWVLLLALLPVLWIVIQYRRGESRLGTLLKGLALTAILIALAEPRLAVPETKVAAVL